MIDQTPQTAVSLLAEAALRAAVEIAQERNLYQPGTGNSSDFARQLSEALKATMLSNLDRIMAEWKEATEAHLSNAWLQKLMTTQAVELALEAIQSLV